MNTSKLIVACAILALLAALPACGAEMEVQPMETLSADDSLNVATFAGGCFWCIEQAFEDLDGVESVVSGYAGGHVQNPTYQQVLSGHYRDIAEPAVRLRYDP